MPKHYFDHEKLKVYQKAIEFLSWFTQLQLEINVKNPVIDHLDRASNSIILNIAEGNGRFTSRDRCHFFDIAWGSALECAAGLDTLVARQIIETDRIIEGKEILVSIVSMLVGLIKSNSNRVHEEEQSYSINSENKSEGLE